MSELISRYQAIWQLPIFVVAAVVALYVGARLLRRALLKRQDRRKTGMGRCVLAVALALFGGVFGGGIVAVFFNALGSRAELTLWPVAMALGLATLVLLYLLVLWAMFALPFRQIAASGAQALAGVLVVTAVVGGVTAVPTYIYGQRRFRERLCREQLGVIHRGIEAYRSMYGGQLPPSLQALVDAATLPEDMLECPGDRSRQPGYLYQPVRTVTEGVTSSIRVCDRAGNHPGGRNVLFANGDVIWKEEPQFQALLDLPENEGFAETRHDASAP